MSTVDVLVLSPHLDDAALSCGGQLHRLAREGRRILVATLHTGEPDDELSPFARELHCLWRLDDGEVITARRREDEAACAELGVAVKHAGLLDALYRRDTDGGILYPDRKALFGRPHSADRVHLDALRDVLAELPSAPSVLAPLGVGGHVDHVLVRRAAEKTYATGLEFYEDYPYVRRYRALWRALWLSRGWPFGWHSRTVPLGEADLAAKLRAIRRYASQLSTVGDGLEAMERQARAFAGRRGGERLWRRRSKTGQHIDRCELGDPATDGLKSRRHE